MFHFLIKSAVFATLVLIAGLLVAFDHFYKEVKLDAKELIDYRPEISSEILDKNGNRLAYVFKNQHRLYAKYEELPGYLVEGLIAMEDTRFFEHNGVNPDAIMRAIVKDIEAGAFVEGGSTLTQQLIKNKILSSEKKIMRKVHEAIMAMKIEDVLTKEEIIERYLNEISYGNNYFGVKTAAHGYFHKTLDQLTLKEAAILVGIPNAPSTYNPLKYYNRVLDRANVILYRMKSLGWITQEMYLKAVKESPEVYRTSLTQNKAPFIVDEVLRRFNGRLGDIRTGGYKIYTTIDMDQQRIAGEAVDFAYQQALEKFNEQEGNTTLNAAFVSVESATGNILSMIGGESYERSSFNRVTQVERQPGSAFKPFIYQTALDMGYNPATPLTDISRSFQYTYKGKPKIWAPKNYEKNFKGFMPLREALVHSRNLATVNLVVDLKVSTIRKRLKFLDVPHIPRDMSIALGNLGVSPLKMAQIFSVFANNGHMIEPRLVSKIISKEGAVIYETRPKEIADFTTPEQAYLMTDILKDVVKRGTGRRARVEGIELAGKTGTTNNSVDAWFCGYSPTIETIVWFGRDDNTPIGKRGATGGGLAAPAFSYYYRELLQLYPDMKTTFDIPDGVMRGYYKDKEEIYTVNSPLPAEERKHEFIDFERRPSDVNGTGEDFYTMDSMEMEVINYGYEDIVEDDINREGQLTAEDLILLEEEKNPGLSQEEQKEKKRDKALHPERKVPQTTVSDDSGALF